MVAAPNPRADFSAATKDLIARRAGYRCGLPNCERVTIGPGASPIEWTSIGVAAHIYSAAPGGPRGSGGLTPQELVSPANAIWLCANHATLVDKNDGDQYPPGLLLSYKSMHEARISRELQGLYARFGWIQEARIHSSPLFSHCTNIRLGKLSLLIGDNSVGKTAICEWLAATISARHLRRWINRRKLPAELNFELIYNNPESHSFRILLPDHSIPSYFADDRVACLPNAPLSVIFPSKLDLRSADAKQLGNLALIAKVLSLDEIEVLTVCKQVERLGTGNLHQIRFEEEADGTHTLYADVSGTVPGLPLVALSGSEQFRVMMEIAIAAANQRAEIFPTMLILDADAWRLDETSLGKYGEFFVSSRANFQTLISIPSRNIDLDKLLWIGWKVFHLEGTPPNVQVSSKIRTYTNGPGF